MLSLRFLEHHLVTSPPINQKKIIQSAALSPIIAYENFSLKTIGELSVFEHKPLVLLAWLCTKFFSALNSSVSVWPHCVSGTKLAFTNVTVA